MRIVKALCALVSILCITVAPAAAEEDEPFAFGPVPGWSVLVGPQFGVSFGTHDPGAFAGLEVSVNRLSKATWAGLYVDAAYDFVQEEGILTAGPQLGYMVMGIDGGIAVRRRDGATDLGPQGRLLLSLPLVSLYGRYAYFADSGDHLGHVGLMFKLPVWASRPGGDR